jgi:hypothetical protein
MNIVCSRLLSPSDEYYQSRYNSSYIIGDHAVFLDFPNQLSKFEKLLLFHKAPLPPMQFYSWTQNTEKKVVRFLLQLNFCNKTQGLTFLSRNWYKRYPRDVKFKNSKYAVLFLDPTYWTKEPLDFFYGEICLTILKVEPLSRNLYGRYP